MTQPSLEMATVNQIGALVPPGPGAATQCGS